MTNAAERQELAWTASRIQQVVLLDSLLTGELAGTVAEDDRATVVRAGSELSGLVGAIPGYLEPVKRWATEEPDELDEIVDRALQAVENTLGLGAAQLRRDFPRESWAHIVLDAIEVLEAGADAEVLELDRKLELLAGGMAGVEGDLGRRFLAGCAILIFVIGCIGPVAVLAGLTIPPAASAILAIAGPAVGLATILGELYGDRPPGPARTS